MILINSHYMPHEFDIGRSMLSHLFQPDAKRRALPYGEIVKSRRIDLQCHFLNRVLFFVITLPQLERYGHPGLPAPPPCFRILALAAA